MAFFRIIFFLLLLTPAMLFLSGCFSDSFLESMNAEEDFIAPFDVVITTEETKRTTYFPITDTGSTTNINGVTGEDGDYNNLTQPDSSNFEEQDVGGDYIVIDHTTGLTWTKCTATAYNTMDPNSDCSGSEITGSLSSASQLMEWSKAASTCKNLDYAGHKDWRLPRLPELLTIADYGRQPAINTSIFPENRGDIEAFNYVKRYSVDDRIRYKKETTGSYTAVNPGNTEYTTTAKFIFEDGVYVFNEGYADNYKEDNTGLYVLAYIDYSNTSVPHYIYADDTGPNDYFDYNSMTHYIYADDTGPNDYFDYNAMTHYIYVNDNGTYSYIDYVSQTHYRFDDPGYSVDPGGAYIYLPLSGTYLHVANYINSNGYYIQLPVSLAYVKVTTTLNSNGYYIQLPVSLAYVNVTTILNSNGYYIQLPVSLAYVNVQSSISSGNEYALISSEYVSIKPAKRYNYDPVWGFGYVQSNTGTYVRLFIKNNEDTYSLSGLDYIKDPGPYPGAGRYVRQYIPDLKVTWAWSAFWGDYVSSTTPYTDGRAKYKFNGTKFVRDDANGKFIQKFETPFGYWTYSSKLMFDANMNTADHGWIVFFQSGGTFGVNIASFKLKTREDLTFEKQFVRCVRGGNGDIDDVDY